MPTLSELRDKLRRPLELERLRGFGNKAVAGGLERLLEGPMASPFPKLSWRTHSSTLPVC